MTLFYDSIVRPMVEYPLASSHVFHQNYTYKSEEKADIFRNTRNFYIEQIPLIQKRWSYISLSGTFCPVYVYE